jgi:hypothetical protein
MIQFYAPVMRTTLTLDEDVAARLRLATQRTGQPFREVVNEALRRGLEQRPAAAKKPFRVKTRDMGALQPGLSIDNIGELLEAAEGPLAR